MFLLISLTSIQDVSAIDLPIEKSRTYIQPYQIVFTETEICVLINGEFTQVKALFTDSNGIYLLFPSGTRDWECPRCGHVNYKAATWCDNCHWDSKKDPIR